MARPAAPTYDTIGRVYARHRRPDPRIAAQIARALGSARTVVDVGAGTGSYEPRDRTVVAVEPSAVMAAQRAAGAAPVVRGRGRAPAVRRRFVRRRPGGAHHSPLARSRGRAARDAPGGARRRRPHLRPRGARASSGSSVNTSPSRPPSRRHVLRAPRPSPRYSDAHAVEPVPIPADCVDGFNVAFWNRPERYLDPEVRACMSGLAMLPDDPGGRAHGPPARRSRRRHVARPSR